MRSVWPVVVLMLVGCRAHVYRGADLQKVVIDEHTAFIEQQMTLLKNGLPAEAVRQLGERARDPAKFEKNRDKAQAGLETALRVGGPMVSYRIIEAEKIKDESDGVGYVSADPGADTKRVTGAQRVTHDGVIVRLEVKFEHASARLGYTFFLIDGIWKTAGLNIDLRASSD